MTDSKQRTNRPWEKAWPEEGLEKVGKCPVCFNQKREVLHQDLVDNVFYAAPGKWSLYKCAGCGVAYLDPRPDQQSIHLAYSNYYTHSPTHKKKSYESLSSIRKLRRRMTNGYTNWRYSTRETPASVLGIFLLLLLWPLRHRLASEYRDIPRCPKSGGSLLDVGCGGGAFLRIAKSAGWNATGVDPDPKAVMNCNEQGFDVLQGGVEQFGELENHFDVITLSHVIEHVHDPASMLRTCYRLLKPGGNLWIATPNIDSLGHQQYGRDWRGLEPPRHLIIFNPKSLKATLESIGFKECVNKKDENPLLSMTKASEAIRRGLSINQDIYLSAIQKFAVITGRLQQVIFPEKKEFLTMTAQKEKS